MNDMNNCVICIKSCIFDVDNDYDYREYIEGRIYHLDRDENFVNGNYYIFVLQECSNKGLRFTLDSCKCGACEPYHYYFRKLSISELRRLKLNRLK